MKKFLYIFLSAFLAFSVVACDEGPAEEAGEKIDEQMEDAGDAMEDAADDVKDAAEDACEEATDKDC